MKKKISLPEKEDICHLNMEDITNADYTHAKKIYKHFEIKIQENIMTFMLKAIHYYCLKICLKICLKMSLKIYELDPAKNYT